MAETWTHPPLLGREAPPRWRAAWRFRLVIALLLLVLVVAFVLLYRQVSGANEQDPGIQDPVPTPVVQVPAPGRPAAPLPGEG